ncbi:hypothetical protein ACXV6R_002048 [Yersinia enterocolitica]
MHYSLPGSYIGNEIVSFIQAQGSLVEYSQQYYSGFITKIFNFHYKGCYGITEGEDQRDFIGGSLQAELLAINRIRLRPLEYSPLMRKWWMLAISAVNSK